MYIYLCYLFKESSFDMVLVFRSFFAHPWICYSHHQTQSFLAFSGSMIGLYQQKQALFVGLFSSFPTKETSASHMSPQQRFRSLEQGSLQAPPKRPASCRKDPYDNYSCGERPPPDLCFDREGGLSFAWRSLPEGLFCPLEGRGGLC